MLVQKHFQLQLVAVQPDVQITVEQPQQVQLLRIQLLRQRIHVQDVHSVVNITPIRKQLAGIVYVRHYALLHVISIVLLDVLEDVLAMIMNMVTLSLVKVNHVKKAV